MTAHWFARCTTSVHLKDPFWALFCLCVSAWEHTCLVMHHTAARRDECPYTCSNAPKLYTVSRSL